MRASQLLTRADIGRGILMKQASFVLGIVATVISVVTALAVAWLYIEKKVKYITAEDDF